MEETREIIPVEVEQTERDKASKRDETKEFITSFPHDTIPACPVGVRILLEFAKASPNTYELARRAHFTDVSGPAGRHPKW